MTAPGSGGPEPAPQKPAAAPVSRRPSWEERQRAGGGRLGALAAALVLALACGGDPGGSGAGGGRRPPVVLVSIDTLRWDHLPAYGYGGVETPALDAFRDEAILFRRAYSHAPMTLPSHASMLTGLLPPEHGARVNMGYEVPADALPYLPRRLRELGYATGAAVSSFVLRRGTGMEVGFDFYDDAVTTRGDGGFAAYERPGGATLEAALPWLASVEDRPFFFFFHLYEPHAPYDPPEPFASRYRLAYDGEIAAADRVVGRLFAELRRLGVYDRALIIVTSDHGDALGDHGERGHGIFVYRSTLQIPLLLRLPGGRLGGGSAAAPVQLVDLPPTVLDLLGEEPDPGLPGRSLLELAEPGAEADRAIYAETYYTRLYFGWSELRTLIDGRYQYIESPEPELYDLRADPDQSRNVLSEAREVAARLRRALAGHPPRFEEPGEFDAATRRRMEALGYVGGARSRFAGELPPPRSQAHLIEALEEAERLYAAGRYGRAVEAYRRIADENPRMIVAWEKLALALRRAGRPRRALAAYQRALELSGGEPHLALAVGEVLLGLGRLAEARSHAEAALAWDEAAARELLARIALADGDVDGAERQAMEGLAARPAPALELVLARVARQRGDLEAALAHARRAEASEAPLPGLYLVLGDVLTRLGRADEAEAAFRREIELFPGDLAAYANLAFLQAAVGRRAQAVETLRGMVERLPSPAAYAAAVRTLRTMGEEAAAGELESEARRRFPRQGPGADGR